MAKILPLTLEMGDPWFVSRKGWMKCWVKEWIRWIKNEFLRPNPVPPLKPSCPALMTLDLSVHLPSHGCVLLAQSPQGIPHILVSETVDEGIQHRDDQGVEDRDHLALLHGLHSSRLGIHDKNSPILKKTFQYYFLSIFWKSSVEARLPGSVGDMLSGLGQVSQPLCAPFLPISVSQNDCED